MKLLFDKTHAGLIFVLNLILLTIVDEATHDENKLSFKSTARMEGSTNIERWVLGPAIHADVIALTSLKHLVILDRGTRGKEKMIVHVA